MTHEFQIVFRNIDQTDALEDAVEKRINKLERYCDQIITGRAVSYTHLTLPTSDLV